MSKPKAVSESKIGAVMHYCGHNAQFMADIVVINGAAVVRANGPVTMANLDRKLRFGKPSHHLTDFPVAGFWRPDLGVFVVPCDQVTVL